jgi:uncharacterized membrane protein YciS (DUF1049 family)
MPNGLFKIATMYSITYTYAYILTVYILCVVYMHAYISEMNDSNDIRKKKLGLFIMYTHYPWNGVVLSENGVV